MVLTTVLILTHAQVGTHQEVADHGLPRILRGGNVALGAGQRGLMTQLQERVNQLVVVFRRVEQGCGKVKRVQAPRRGIALSRSLQLQFLFLVLDIRSRIHIANNTQTRVGNSIPKQVGCVSRQLSIVDKCL